MKIHREGYPTLGWGLVILGLVVMITYSLAHAFLAYVIGICCLFYLMLLHFFRDPDRRLSQAMPDAVLAPADGKVVVIEEVDDPLMDGLRSMQVSIFMSPVNVHINRVPIDGTLSKFSYHPGKYLVAWHPKSSLENERTELRMKTALGDIGLKQIAGAVARRIVCYKQEAGMRLEQGEELGFIKFGSRVDLLLPMGLDIKVSMGDQVKGNRTVIAQRS